MPTASVIHCVLLDQVAGEPIDTGGSRQRLPSAPQVAQLPAGRRFTEKPRFY
jgi:hypothetical protein